MGQKNSKNSVWKWIFSILAITAILITASAIYLNYQWKPIIAQRIKTAVNTSTDGLYNIDFENIRINIVSGRISIKNIEFAPDTMVYQKMQADSIAPRHLYKVRVRELTLKRVHPWKTYFNGMLQIGSVEIDKPELEVSFNDNKNSGDSQKEDKRTAYQRLSPYLKSLKVGAVVFKNADFKYIDHDSSPARITGLKDLTIKVTDLLIDSASQYDKSRLYHTKDIYAELNSYRSVTEDGSYTVQIQQISASTANGYAKIKGFRLIPVLGEMEFSRQFKVQKDRYSADFEELVLRNINYKILNKERKLIASAMKLERAGVSIFLNRAMPDSIRNRGLNFPQLVLSRFKLNTKIDTLIIQDSRVNYSEYNPDSRRKGTVIFSKINGLITNITNDSLALIKNRNSEVKLTALLMDRGRFNMALLLNLTDPEASFSFKGNVGRMDASMFNAAIRPLSLIEIKSGNLEKMDFSGAGSTRGVKGSVACYYNDLKIALLEKSENTTWLKRRGIASIFANVLIIKSENPSPGEEVRKVDFNYVRPQHSSFFNMIWKGLSSSLLGSIGFDEQTQREIKARMRKMEIERFAREERRDEREKRKVIRKFKRNIKRR
jgi:hypothetical protein